MRNITITLLTQIVLLNLSYTQVSEDKYLQGYAKEVNGFTLNYHSPLPEVNSSLLIRARKDFTPIEWETEIVPENYNEDFVSFIWMYGTDTDVENYEFDLYVNGDKCFTFSNPADNEKSEWSIEGKDSAVLTFNVTLIDKYKDQMGFAILKLPLSSINPGKPVILKVDGEDAGSNIWYMTFKSQIQEQIDVVQEDVVMKKNGQLYHVARFDFIHVGEETKGTVIVGRIKENIVLKSGYNSLEFILPKADIPVKYTAKIKVGNKPETEREFWMNPVKEWEVYFVQHTHTDIGYTRSQTEILPEHLRYIDYALDFCDQTDNYPDNAKFRWTCEASWPVREYLKSRPREQIDRFIKRVKEKRIEVTGMFFNYSEIVDETRLAEQTKILGQFKDLGINVSTAMQNDVNGIGWCMADYFQDTGVKYLIMGQHGHRARVPFDKPTAFWWESPSGKRLLAFRSEHYMYGNTLGLTSGDIKGFRKQLTKYLGQLKGKDYPYLHTALQYSGYITDNAPPSTIACDLVKEWNDNYEWPKLKIAVASEFMNYLEENHSKDLSVKKVAWPDWWTDGVGSAMNEAKAIRSTHSEMIANTGLLAMAKCMGAQLPEDINKDITDVQYALLFYDEHTYGAAESISDPLAENSVIQWNEKSAYAWEAVKKSRMLTEKAMGYIQPYINKSEVPTIAVFNTLNWARSGLVTIYIDHEILPNNKKFNISDFHGNEIAIQSLESRSDGTYWGLWVENIPAMGYKLLKIEVSNENRIVDKRRAFENIFENDFYKLTIDVKNGVITSMLDKELQLELLDNGHTIKMGQFIYERLANRHQMERFTYNKTDTVFVPLDGERYNMTDIEVLNIQEGPVWTSLYIHGKIQECADDRGVNMEIRLYNKEKLLELHYDMHKLAVTEPEAVYVAFPFDLADGRLYFEAQGGLVSPGVNQLEGTSSDWNTIQNFASVRNDKSQIIFGSNDIPLVQFGDINTGRYYYKHQPETMHIYSWILNNYWTTNFKASQEGEMKWSYYVTSSSDNSNAFATRFGWGNRIPLLTRVFPAGDEEAKTSSQSLINIDSPNILLISAKPAMDGKGIILHLRETEGETTSIDMKTILNSNIYTTVSEVNVFEENIVDIKEKLALEPFETKFIRIRN